MKHCITDKVHDDILMMIDGTGYDSKSLSCYILDSITNGYLESDITPLRVHMLNGDEHSVVNHILEILDGHDYIMSTREGTTTIKLNHTYTIILQRSQFVIICDNRLTIDKDNKLYICTFHDN